MPRNSDKGQGTEPKPPGRLLDPTDHMPKTVASQGIVSPLDLENGVWHYNMDVSELQRFKGIARFVETIVRDGAILGQKGMISGTRGYELLEELRLLAGSAEGRRVTKSLLDTTRKVYEVDQWIFTGLLRKSQLAQEIEHELT